MRRGWPLLALSVGLDLVGMLAGGLLAAELRQLNPALVLQTDVLVFGIGFLFVAWFFGGYSFLRWPWMPYWQLVQRWLLVLVSALGLAVLAAWLMYASPTAVWWQPSSSLIVGVVMLLWGAAAALAATAGADPGQPAAGRIAGGRG